MDDFLVTHNTGKTSGVKAMFKILSGSKGVTCVYVSDESFDKLSVQDVFAFINKYLAPALVVFEDIDLIAPDRRDVGSRLIGPLLSALNGIEEQKKPIVIMATTNRLDVLDAAVTRPCRFDRRIEVGYPSEAEMHAIFRNVAGFEAPTGCFHSDGSTKMTGAHVEEIYRTAALLAQQKGKKTVDCVKEAVETIRKHFMIVSPKLKGFNVDEEVGTVEYPMSSLPNKPGGNDPFSR
jgi:SpoVK/Ycf46/Vps4 family AAA+-type ATPase